MDEQKKGQERSGSWNKGVQHNLKSLSQTDSLKLEHRPTRASFSIDRKIAVPTAMAAASIAAWTKMSHGNTLKYTFVPSMAASLALYMLTFRKRMPDSDAIAPLYFLALAWQLVHFVEENSTGFRYRWPIEIFGAKPYGERQYVAINALSYAVFIAGGVALLKKARVLLTGYLFCSDGGDIQRRPAPDLFLHGERVFPGSVHRVS